MIQLTKAVDVMVETLLPAAKDQMIFDAVIKYSGNAGLIKPFAGNYVKGEDRG